MHCTSCGCAVEDHHLPPEYLGWNAGCSKKVEANRTVHQCYGGLTFDPGGSPKSPNVCTGRGGHKQFCLDAQGRTPEFLVHHEVEPEKYERPPPQPMRMISDPLALIPRKHVILDTIAPRSGIAGRTFDRKDEKPWPDDYDLLPDA